MKANRIIITFLLVLPIVFPTHLFAQNHTLQGFVRDATTDEPLIGATVFQPASQKGTSTGNNGYFRLTTSAKATL
ncbi:carboxypeptidase-like regulatory domain-containing protein [Sunxiuqinia indica]|uniref:carboxypeptidase-like regulatory domain-containing protein n=1 Tax=Sunxiuqinia indica TaxID=2692584 RepID=UPI00135B4B20|nr:carboxypeptidase-like regulatory domain-containing protein [Sunxiuqinia indica]